VHDKTVQALSAHKHDFPANRIRRGRYFHVGQNKKDEMQDEQADTNA
jgi:hypothetical protein